MCGVFACSGVDNAIELILDGNFCLNHRGQEGAGVVVWDHKNEVANPARRFGLASHLMSKSDLTEYPGITGIGHVRYGTRGESNLANVQPLVRDLLGERLSIAHNGDFVKVEFEDELLSVDELKLRLEKDGAIFASTSDTEILFSLIARSKKGNMVDRIIDVLNRIHGAFCLTILWRDHVIAARDPWGFHPLWLGKYGPGHVLSSEDCAFGHLGIEPIREIKRGEVIVITPEQQVKSYQLDRQVKSAFCSFEFVYLARPDSNIFDQSVSQVRRLFGRETGLEMLAAGTLPLESKVVPVLDSGRTSSLGFYEVILREQVKAIISSGVNPDDIPLDGLLQFGIGINRNQFSLRNFIIADEASRIIGADLKHNVDQAEVKGQNITELDDSIVRGDTTARHVARLKNAGARDVNVVIPSPPVTNSCYYGVATRKTGKLVAATHTLEETREKIGSDTLTHLSGPGFKKCLGSNGNGFCTACFDGQYPIPPD